MTFVPPYNGPPRYPHYGPPQQWQPPPPPPKRKVRVFSWVIVGINALFVLWMIMGIVSAADRYGKNCQGLSQSACETAQGIGSTIGLGLILFVWVAVDVILGVIWLVTRKR